MPENPTHSRSVVEHAQYEQRRRDYWDHQQELRQSIEKCAKALERGQLQHYQYVGQQLTATILPAFLTDKPATEYDGDLAHRAGWNYGALTDFRAAPERYIRQAGQRDPTATDTARVLGTVGGPQQARETIVGAFRSAVCIAEHEDVVAEELLTRVDAVGFCAKIGEHLQDAEMQIGEPVGLVSELSGALKTLHCGGTGQGKSTGLEREAEDYYLTNWRRGRDMKLIDLVGMRDGENWFYDIPQQDADLRDAREAMGLPPSFAEDEDREAEPDLEILVPLTEGLTTEQLPYDTDSDRFTVRPFTVPASEIRKPLLVSMLVTQLSPQMEAIVRDAYDEVDRRETDWALKDLADEVRARDELPADKKKPVIRTLRQLQHQGFIRTAEDGRTIDWRDIFTSPETITVFSQAFGLDEIGKYITFGYLIHTIVRERETMHDVPQCALLMRELWKVAPHNRRQSFDGRAAALQEAIGHMLAEIFRENRHSGIHVLADTQQPSDLLKPVREMFNRYVVYDTNRDATKDIFEWTANDKWQSFYRSLSPKAGHASVVGMVEPAVSERDIEFVGPVQYAPPSHHHRIETEDLTGWHARCKYLERETLTTPAEQGAEWDDQLPTKLEIAAQHTDDSADVTTQPVVAFAEECLTRAGGQAVQRQAVYKAFNAYVTAHDREPWDFDSRKVSTRFGKRLSSYFGDDTLSRTHKDSEVAWSGVTWTNRGAQFAAKDDATPESDAQAAGD